VIIASPEYNYGMSGVLKNALDWASRPYGKAKLTGKPVLTVTVSPASTGGVRAQIQLNETLTAIAALVVLRPSGDRQRLPEMTDGVFTDETARVPDRRRRRPDPRHRQDQAVIKQES